jgi:hypothetical protein
MSLREQLIKELLSDLTPRELRVFMYEVRTHTCTGRSLRCCELTMCEQCLTLHLIKFHSEEVKRATEFFSKMKQLVPPERKTEVLTLCGRIRKDAAAKANHEKKCLDCAERAIDPLAKQKHGFLREVKAKFHKVQVKATPKLDDLLESLTLEQLEELLAKRK